jgi:hypothetical protein
MAVWRDKKVLQSLTSVLLYPLVTVSWTTGY